MNRIELPEYLFERIKLVEPYPEGIAAISQMLACTAFFPGGRGLWNESKSNEFPTILVLGQDFSTENKFIEMISNNSNDLDGPTWRNMIQLFNSASINLSSCFFSNVFMGLRRAVKMTGRFPGFKDKEFVRRSIEYLKIQIITISPRTIITLGKHAAEMLASTTPSLDAWKKGNALICEDIGLFENVAFLGHRCNCIALEHPSMRNSNVKRRRYKGKTGNEAELLMLMKGT